MKKMFGISLDEFMLAVYGDQDSIKRLSDLGRLSEVASRNLPQALEAARLTIETTGSINKAISDLTTQTAKSGKQVTGAVLSSQVVEKKFNNELQELKQKHDYDSTNEDTRHLYQSSLIDMRGRVGELMAVTRYQTDVMKEQNKLPMAEHKAEIDYNQAVSNMLWAEGSDARIDLIPKPNYSGNAKGLGKLWKNFKSTFGI